MSIVKNKYINKNPQAKNHACGFLFFVNYKYDYIYFLKNYSHSQETKNKIGYNILLITHSLEKGMSNKIAYELKCEGCASYAEWLDNNREKLILEENITGMYARVLGDMGCVLLMENAEEIKESLEVAIEQLKGRMEKTPELCNVIDVSIVMAVYEKLLDLIGKDNFVEEVKKANKLFDSIMPDRHNAVDSFL